MSQNLGGIGPLPTVGLLAFVFAALFVLERLAPLRARRRSVWPRVLVNMGVALSALVVALGLILPAVSALLAWTEASRFGVLQWFDLPASVELVFGFLLLDVAYYGWHRANHAVPLLWRFHAAHHIDPDLDVTTATRFHFGEMLFSVAFQAVQIVLLGVPALTYVVYEVVFQAGTLFHHSNWRLPQRLEGKLNWLFVTPRMHGIHHSQVRHETHSNFSVVFNVWDRVFRTLRLDVPQGRIVIGVPGYDREQDNHLRRVLAAPFRRQRAYWQGDN
ncbi:MAG: sterol desaturase family protein [Myxococcota bacterium]